MNLIARHCIPCKGGDLPLDKDKTFSYLKQLPLWRLAENKNNHLCIRREFKFRDFKKSLDFVNRVGEIAETEGHHPDIEIHYNKVSIVLWTHALKGLSINDFILAAKIDAIV